MTCDLCRVKGRRCVVCIEQARFERELWLGFAEYARRVLGITLIVILFELAVAVATMAIVVAGAITIARVLA